MSWLLPADLIDDQVLQGRSRILPLDIVNEKERYGGQTRGGVGVSIPVAT